MKMGKLLVMGMLALAATAIGVVSSSDRSTVEAKVHYSSKTFPKSIRGTWYTYSGRHYDKIVITAKTLKEEGHTSRLKVRKSTTTIRPGTKVKHPSWVYSNNLKYRGQSWAHVYGWYQTAGSGEFYRKTTHKLRGYKRATLQLGYGAGIWTVGHAYHSKALARQYSHKHFKGERVNNY